MEIYVLRSRLPANLPFLGLSATLSDKILQEIKDSCGFRSDKLSVIKTPLDRPEIYIQVKPFSGTMKDLDDLHHLLPATATRATDIPKTIVFMESISSIRATSILMRGWMRRLGYPKESRAWLETYFSEMSDLDKDDIAARFLRSSEDCGGPRILIATDAYGLGVDNPDVARVVQVKIPRKLSVAIQRMGRAMRSGKQQAWYLFLYQKNMAVDIDDSQLSQSTTIEDIESSQSDPKQTQSNEAQSSNICLDIDAIILASKDGRCIRQEILERLDAVDMEGDFVKPTPCCSSCDTDSADKLDTHEVLKQEAYYNALKKPWFQQKIGGWRTTETSKDNNDLLLGYAGNQNTVIPAKPFANILRYADLIRDTQALRTSGGRGWAASEKETEEVLSMLREGQGYGPTSEKVRRAAMNLNQQSYRDRAQERVRSGTSTALRLEAEREWQLSRGISNTQPRAKANKRKRLPETPAKNSPLSQVMSTPPVDLELLTPPSTVDNKENQYPLSQQSQSEPSQIKTGRSLVEINPPRLKKGKRSTKTHLATPEHKDSDRVLQPSSTRQNRQKPKRLLD